MNGGTVAFNPVDDKQVTSNTLIIHGNGVLNVTNNGTFSVTGGISNSGTIALKDSTFTCDYGFSNSGIITMDASSLLVADNITGITDTNKIRITVDVDSFTGFNKLIDLSRSTENTLEDEVIYVDANGNEITAETLAENDIRAIYSADGDISLAKLGDKIVYVNSAWENQNDVDATFGADSGIIYSENAFSSMTDVTAPETATSLHILGGNYANPFGDKSSDEVNLLKGGITTVAADNGTVTLTLGNLVFNSKNAGEYNINGNFAIYRYIFYNHIRCVGF